MAVAYAFQNGEKVYVKSEGMDGEITSMVPGNGSIPWYYVRLENGQMDRYTADDLESVY